MPLDALCIWEVTKELQALVGSRVDKVQQPERDVLLLHLRGGAGAVRLLVSAGSGSARVHLTRMDRENPAEPPMFCMLLRKHLSGARLLSLEQPAWERVMLLRFACLDEMGEASEKTLAVEMMGRNANIILADGAGRILDCLHKADPMSAPKRPLLPGLFYALPPAQEKESIFLITEEGFREAFDRALRDQNADDWLVQSFAGVSPLLAREIVWSATGESDARLRATSAERLWAAFTALRDAPGRPTMLLRADAPYDLYCRPIRQYGGALRQERMESFSQLLDGFYTEKERLAHQQQRSQALVKLIRNRRERAARKLASRLEERKATAQRETWRQYGDLIKANLYRMKRGQTALEAENFYDPDSAPVVIPLEAKLSPQQNAERYYKLYTKAKNAEKVLAEQIAEAQRELEYLESVQQELKLAAGEKDLGEIRQELISQGYLHPTDKRRRKDPPPRPLRFRSPDGCLIQVGKNNLQNDWPTLKSADKNDLWFHVQKSHGSHVVARCTREDREAVEAAALLAAWYSDARDSANVPVDYTLVRYVKKPSGARPGMVIYTDYKTIYVTPERGKVEALEQIK
ncbi:MAG: NFACT family protein [Oscillospiraceae bacterium]|nr:NFACT family protein [Oscillospiraceae bacterium]